MSMQDVGCEYSKSAMSLHCSLSSGRSPLYLTAGNQNIQLLKFAPVPKPLIVIVTSRRGCSVRPDRYCTS